jgi:hypothetical protein
MASGISVMSGLEAWEQAWEEWLLMENSPSVPPTLSDIAILPTRVPAERQLWLSTARTGRTQQLMGLLSPRLIGLLGPDFVAELLERLPLSFVTQAHLGHLKLALLMAFEHVLNTDGVVIPHLEQVFDYEKALLKLTYHRLPKAYSDSSAPVLTDWACLISAGPHFSAVLECLRLGQTLPLFSELPLQTYLLTRDLAGARLEALHPLVAACLHACDGKRLWPEIIEHILKDYSGPRLEPSALLEWQQYLVRRGVLRLSSAAELALFLGET